MEDLNKIQEFFSKPLEEGKQLDQVDFAKVVKAVEQTGHPVTVLLVPKWNEIEVLTGMNAPDDIIRDLSNAVDSLGYGRNDIIIAGDSSNLSRREYSDIRRVNGGAKDYFEEYNSGIYYKEDNTADKAKEAGDSALKKVKDMIQKVLKEEEGYSQYLKTDDNPDGKTKGLDTATMNKILMNVIKDLDELKQLGEGVIEEELCAKGKAYRKKRQAAGEKSSAYLSGRAVKVCKGQMKG
jgi:hypothetical protein